MYLTSAKTEDLFSNFLFKFFGTLSKIQDIKAQYSCYYQLTPKLIRHNATNRKVQSYKLKINLRNDRLSV